MGDVSGDAALGFLIYAELRTLAHRALRYERRPFTLQPTALANEAWIRLSEQRHLELADRQAFLSLAAHMIRRILVDHARARRRLKRHADGQRVTLADGLLIAPALDLDVIALHEALDKLSGVDARMA